jgi:hypothetical protein
MAVSQSSPGQGFGEFLLMHALERAWLGSQQAASWAVVTRIGDSQRTPALTGTVRSKDGGRSGEKRCKEQTGPSQTHGTSNCKSYVTSDPGRSGDVVWTSSPVPTAASSRRPAAPAVETVTKLSARTEFIAGPTSELLTILLWHVPILTRNCIHY